MRLARKEDATMMRIVTYQLAYLSHVTVDLCDRHAATDRFRDAPLGPVSHGLHEGVCQACADEGGGHGR
jgi:hypothetical protein